MTCRSAERPFTCGEINDGKGHSATCKQDISESEGDDVIVTWITQSWISINSITDEKVSKK